MVHFMHLYCLNFLNCQFVGSNLFGFSVKIFFKIKGFNGILSLFLDQFIAFLLSSVILHSLICIDLFHAQPSRCCEVVQFQALDMALIKKNEHFV